MKQAFVLGLALLGSVGVAASASAHEAAHHKAHKAHHHHAKSSLSQADIAKLPTLETVTITDCWIRHLPLPAPSAGYFIATNSGDKPIVLTAAASPRYGDVMLHQTTHTDGMSRMSSVDGAEIGAGGQLDFKPGGYHIMLEQPQGEINVGDEIPMQFIFDSNEKAEATCEVKPANTLSK